MSWTDHLAADRRLVILRVLREAPAYSANDSVLHSAAEAMGHRISRDVVRTDMSWLSEQGLIRLETLPVAGGRSVYVGALQERGLDVAEGRARVPGVKAPAP